MAAKRCLSISAYRILGGRDRAFVLINFQIQGVLLILDNRRARTYLLSVGVGWDCTARQCLPLRRKFMRCFINSPALSLLMKHLVIGQR